MPLNWVPPDEYLRFKDFVVYHVYRGDDYRDGVREYWYSLTATGTDCDGKAEGVFHVRELPDVPDEYREDIKDDTKRRITHAIEIGYFDDWEHDTPSEKSPLATLADLERLMQIAQDAKKEFNYLKDNGKWYWTDRGVSRPCGGPFAAFADALVDAVSPYLEPHANGD